MKIDAEKRRERFRGVGWCRAGTAAHPPPAGTLGNRPDDRGRYRDRWQEQNWVLALRRLIFHDPGKRRLSCECPVRRKHGAALGAIKTKPLRGDLKARLDSPCAQPPSV